MDQAVAILPHVNATLNASAMVLLVVGYLLIKRGREQAHQRTMLASFAVSAAFLICYVAYHALAGSKRFPTDAPTLIRYVYYTILLSHVLLAAAVPFLAVVTIYLGLRDRRLRHRRIARWTFPIWLYVSLSGVLVYLLLYHIYAHA